MASPFERLFPRVLHPPFTAPIYFQRRSVPKNRLLRFLYGFVAWNYELVVNERIVEIPFVLRNLDLPRGARILDFGCGESPVSLHLASLGYRVVGVDLNPYPFRHTHFQFIQGDFLKKSFPDNYFDAVLAISAIEHCGLDAYGDAPQPPGDERIVGEIFRVLRPGGHFLLTVPYGRPGQTSWYRVYDKASLSVMLASFQILKTEFYVGINRKEWVPASEEEIAQVESVQCGFVQGVACVVAVRP